MSGGGEAEAGGARPSTPSPRDVVRDLMGGYDLADAVLDPTDRVEMFLSAGQTFRETAFGKVVLKISRDGFSNIPFCATEDDALEKASAVVDAANTHILSSTPHKERVMIKGQTRFALEAKYMGVETASTMKEAGKAASAVMRAVVDGASTGVVTYRESVLANAEKTDEQIWHRDEKAHKVLDRMKTGRRKRAEPPPFSAIVGFQSGTKLHVVRGSHRRGTESDFSKDEGVGHGIPTGWCCLFNSILVHHGMGSDDEHVRGHIYLTALGCTLPSFGEIETTVKGPGWVAGG